MSGTGLEPILVKAFGPPVERAAVGAATKVGNFLYADWRKRSKVKRTRAAAVNVKLIEDELIGNVPGLTHEVAARLIAYLKSADFADICLRLALELAPLSAKSREQAADSSAIRSEFLASLRMSVSPSDDTVVKVIGKVLFSKLVEATVKASLSHAVPESASPELRGIAVTAATNAARASLRNTELLTRLGSLTEVWKFESRLRDQIRTSHANMKLPHAGSTRNVPYSKLFVEPQLFRKQVKGDDEELKRISLKELLPNSPRTVILGNPGGGKSTLALKQTYDTARSPIQGAKPAVPFLVILRDYSESFKYEKKTLVAHLESLCRDPYNVEPPDGAIEYLLLNGRAFVIFDGLDELTDASIRKRLVQNVEAFSSLYPTVPILVTSREVGYDQAALDPSAFTVFNLATLNEEQVTEYTAKWFSLDESVEKQQRQALAMAFLSDSQYVADLRTNPLMLSLMCGIYSSEHYIPSNRPEVYRKCAELLFERWDKQRGIFTPLPFDAHVRLALNALALWMYSNPDLQNGLTRSALTRFMTQYLLEKRFSDEAEAENAAIQFIDFCTGRAWVLTDVGSNPHQELYGFTHRTFLEYFAANQLVRLNPSAQGLFSALADKLAAQEWDVVAQLALQILGNNVEDGSDDFLTLLIDASQREQDKGRRRSLDSFAARSLTFIVPKPDLIRRISNATINALNNESDQVQASRAPQPHDDLLQCSDENLPTVARALSEEFGKRLEADPHDETALFLSLVVGEYGNSGQINPIHAGRKDFWHSEQQKNLAKFHAFFESQALEKPWFDVMRATMGEVSITEVIARHGVRALFVYCPAGRSFAAPFAFRYWNSGYSFSMGWRDQQRDLCASELTDILSSIQPPWLDLADEEVYATVGAVSRLGNQAPTVQEASVIPAILMGLPVIEGVPNGRWNRDPLAFPGNRDSINLTRVFTRLYDARNGDMDARIYIMTLIGKPGQSANVRELVNAWMSNNISLSYVSSKTAVKELQQKQFDEGRLVQQESRANGK